MKIKLLLIFLMSFAVVSSQYFSWNDGTSLPRNGKRSYNYQQQLEEKTGDSIHQRIEYPLENFVIINLISELLGRKKQ